MIKKFTFKLLTVAAIEKIKMFAYESGYRAALRANGLDGN